MGSWNSSRIPRIKRKSLDAPFLGRKASLLMWKRRPRRKVITVRFFLGNSYRVFLRLFGRNCRFLLRTRRRKGNKSTIRTAIDSAYLTTLVGSIHWDTRPGSPHSLWFGLARLLNVCLLPYPSPFLLIYTTYGPYPNQHHNNAEGCSKTQT